jgi:aminoglycoside phosphotransferase (APT) family kinase protein
MSARQDGALATVATALGLDLVAVLGGGEFGAALVRDGSGSELVLKALPGEVWAARFARGAELSARVRSGEYPVPRYVGTGVSDGVSWSLQERLAGDVPDVMTGAHAEQLVALAHRHAGAAGREGDVHERFDRELDGAAERLAGHPDAADAAAVATELAGALASRSAPVRTSDVVHGDFHHRNYLASGDRVTGVFDWELAWTGDWRVDLVNLACWASWAPSQVSPAARRVVVDAAVAACEPEVIALFTAFHTLRALDFDARHHPDRLPGLLAVVDRTTRRWVRPA